MVFKKNSDSQSYEHNYSRSVFVIVMRLYLWRISISSDELPDTELCIQRRNYRKTSKVNICRLHVQPNSRPHRSVKLEGVGRVASLLNTLKGVMMRPMVDAVSELCSHS